jgi:hypothetical protein
MKVSDMIACVLADIFTENLPDRSEVSYCCASPFGLCSPLPAPLWPVSLLKVIVSISLPTFVSPKWPDDWSSEGQV